MVVSLRAGEGSWAASPSCSAVESDRVQAARMEVEIEPPDRGGFSKVEGGGPGLSSPLAAAVKASLHEGREAKTAGGYLPGEGSMRMETAAAAVVFSQAEGGGGAQGGL